MVGEDNKLATPLSIPHVALCMEGIDVNGGSLVATWVSAEDSGAVLEPFQSASWSLHATLSAPLWIPPPDALFFDLEVDSSRQPGTQSRHVSPLGQECSCVNVTLPCNPRVRASSVWSAIPERGATCHMPCRNA